MNAIQVIHHVSPRMGENRIKNRQPHSLGGPRRASNRTPDQSFGLPEEWLQPFSEGLTRGFTSSTDESPAVVSIPAPELLPSAHPQQNLPQIKQGESTIYSHISQGPELRSVQTHESYECAMQKKSCRSDGQNFNSRTTWGSDDSRPQGS